MMPQCADCINNTGNGCADDSMCVHAAHARITELERVVNLGYRMSGNAGCSKKTNRREFLTALYEEIELFQQHAKDAMGDKLDNRGMMNCEWR